jgi:glycosyltransferase involved in cell wall biosynthesis
MFSDNFGGRTTTFIYNEVEYLSQKHDLLYLCNKSINDNQFSYDYVDVIQYNWNSFFKKIQWKLWQSDLHLSFKNKDFANELNKEIEKFKPDIIHCHFGFEALKILENIRNKNIPIVVHFHGYCASQMMLKKSYARKMKYYLSQKNVFPIFVTEHFRKRFQDNKINVSKSILLYCGIDTEKFKRNHYTKKDKKTFLQVSSLAEKKGQEFTIRAFAQFIEKEGNKNFQLVITGDGANKELLIRLTQDFNIADYVKFVGNVSHQQAKELMESADFFVHHSVTATNGDQEGIPNAIMEAMAMELPIISTFHSGIPELVKDGVNGYLVQEKDIKTYAQRMHDILNWDYKTENRQRVIDYFEYYKHNQQLEEFYTKIIGITK